MVYNIISVSNIVIMEKKYKIIIADDNKFFLDALDNYLSSFKDFKIMATCNSIKETIVQTNNTNFDLLILDLSFNGEKSLDYLQQIRPKGLSFKIICLTSYNNGIIKEEAITNGIDLFIGKDNDLKNFPIAIRELLNNARQNSKNAELYLKPDLTTRQIDIIKACFEFSTEKDIANHLGISINTLKTHKQHIFAKTCAKNNLELIKYGIKEGIIII
ncbi:response regulator transcription factor [Wenyingzhuangia sp. 1_MG-2023]|nr:response regulator transcription factor [Wenyingzhuangia sp. 1_MG-2023]